MGKGNPGGQHQAGVIGQTQVTFHNVHYMAGARLRGRLDRMTTLFCCSA
jgi:hypothetical protein